MPTSCWTALILWFLLFNVVAFFSMGSDKLKAMKGKTQYRTPEKNFFILSALGGAFGCLGAMYFFHHKTKHKKFKFGLPALALWNVVLYAGLIFLMKKFLA